jgi:hypothetical protein
MARFAWVRKTLGLIAALGAFAAMLWYVPKRQVPQDVLDPAERFGIEDAARKTLAQALGGGFFLLTAYFTWRTVRAAEDNLRVSQGNLRISEDKQISERFAKASEGLGSEKLAVRLGGIYTLERIVRDSKADADSVIELLSAFVREARPLRSPSIADSSQSLPTDVQAALTALGRCNPHRSSNVRIELFRTDLTRADLYQANFAGANLTRSNLINADLMGANLSGADLIGAHLTGADVSGADFSEAFLVDAELSFSDDDSAVFKGAWY